MDVLVGGLANTLERAPFARGGEGTLYDFRWPGDRRAVKLYASDGGAERRRERAMYLVAHPPSRLRDTAGDAWELAWPERLVTHVDGRFAGVSMVRVRHAVRLSELTAHAHVLARRLGRRWLAYQLPTPLSLALRLQLAARVSQLVRAVHAEGRYVLTDLKPDNLLVTETGRVTLVDCDSVQVTEQGALRFASRVRTDDYTPPEGFDPAFVARWEGGAPLQTSWDGFSLSVIIYQLLLGIHPFAVRGRDTQRGVAVDTVRDAIRAGLYAHGPRRMDMLLIPPPHGGVASLPAVVRAALERSLAVGHNDPARRLSAQEWCDVLVPLTHRRRIWLGVRRRLAGDAARARDGAAFLWRGGTVALSWLESCRSTLARQFTRPLDIAKREVVAFLLGGSVVGLLLSFTVLASPRSVSVLEQTVTVPLYPPFPVELMTPPVAAPDARW
ncbi:MAG: hypothetical protein IPJ56_02715 [Gemmatimonadetes bacterium]|nr:hypothetical protein [Gemmatimonadota bacterium]